MHDLVAFAASARPAPSGLGARTRLKWAAFRLLALAAQQRGEPTPAMELPAAGAPLPALWVFATTIGELNGIEPFLTHLRQQMPFLRLVLISDRAMYRETYARRHPDAEVCITHGHVDDARRLARYRPPRLFVVAEIPCLPGESPCRLSCGFAFEAKRQGALVSLVNGWLYDDAPASRIDAIERRLFGREHLRAFDALGVQTEAVAQRLRSRGARPETLAVTGNLKFDAMQRQSWRPEQARSAALLARLLALQRCIVVAGCVTSFEEQALVLDAFVALRRRLPGALLVIAPRHPELTERMRKLDASLAERGLQAVYKSAERDDRVDAEVQCLVIDVVGELRDFYAAATVAHVGVNHNALEPLAFSKPVTVIPGWLPEFASYPVYTLLMEKRCLIEATSAAALAQAWFDAAERGRDGAAAAARIEAALAPCRGATERNAALLAAALAPAKGGRGAASSTHTASSA